MHNEIDLEKSRAWEMLKPLDPDLNEEFYKNYGDHQDKHYRLKFRRNLFMGARVLSYAQRSS